MLTKACSSYATGTIWFKSSFKFCVAISDICESVNTSKSSFGVGGGVDCRTIEFSSSSLSRLDALWLNDSEPVSDLVPKIK